MTDEPLVIALVGMPASGKSVVAEYLVEKKNAYRVHLGDYVWKFLEERGIKKTQETGVMAGLYLADIYNDVPIAEYAISQIKKGPKRDIYVVDSLRNKKEHDILKSHFKRYYLISVNTDPDIRYGRELRRARFGERLTKQDFESRDKGELRMGAGILIALADFSIDANKNKLAVYNQIKDILRQIEPTS